MCFAAGMVFTGVEMQGGHSRGQNGVSPVKQSSGLPVVHWNSEETSSPGVGNMWVSHQQGMDISGKGGRKQGDESEPGEN